MSNPKKVSDPRAVLQRIDSRQPVSPPTRSLVPATDAPAATAAVASTNSTQAAPPKAHRLRVVRHDDAAPTFEDRLDEHIEMPQQVIELADHLKHSRQKLVQREQELNRSVAAWREDLESQRVANSATASELQNRERQLRSLQFHLLQMQNDLVDSQMSMESVIKHFENVDSDEYLQQALELLRFEVLDRFDYLSKRWEMLHDRLEALRCENPLRKCA